MVNSLYERFSGSKDGSIPSALGKLFNPVLGSETVEDDIEIVTEYLNSVEMEGYRDELAVIVVMSITDKKSCVNLAIKNEKTFPASV